MLKTNPGAPPLLTHTTLNPEAILKQLTLNEKISLLSGVDMWHTQPIDRLGVPSVRVSDGPNGVRGTKFFDGVPASCFPCASALGSTFDVDLIRRVGAAIGDEAIAKGAACVLGPTCNIQRNPLGGRGFESYSEDPLLSGKMSAAFINGLQSKDVAATIKHFVANDSETLRNSMSSEVQERALREIYLRPFEIAVRESKPLSFMTSYNRLNGLHCSEDKNLLDTILRKEWGWEGMIMSDWWGTYSTDLAVEAGLDLEMPGVTKHRGDTLAGYVTSAKKILPSVIDARALAVLKFVKACLKAPISYPDKPEQGLDFPETRRLLRTSARESIVLLKNDAGVLPVSLDHKKVQMIAVIGQNADMAQISGGGSASMRPTRAVSPLEGIREMVGEDVEVKYTVGAYAHKLLPPIGSLLKTPSSGGVNTGFDLKFYNELPFISVGSTALLPDAKVAHSIQTEESTCFLAMDRVPNVIAEGAFLFLSGLYTPYLDGEYDFGLVCCGKGKLFVNDELVVDNWDNQTRGDNFFGTGTVEERGRVHLKSGKTYSIKLNFRGGQEGLAFGNGNGAFRVGVARVIDEEEEVRIACRSAETADVVVLVCGLNSEWESEGFDRKDMSIPDSFNKLVDAVLDVNPQTIVVTQSGTPIEMPWIRKASTVLHQAYGGNELGGAIADVIFGKYNPAGKLAQTFPRIFEDSPGFLGFPGENGKLYYNDGIFVGYRGFDEFKREPLFSFGYGLSYSSFALGSLFIPSASFYPASPLGSVTVTVSILNTSTFEGAETVQLYVTPPKTTALVRPKKELKDFKKAVLQGGESKNLTFTLDKCALGYWDNMKGCWVAEKGEYGIRVWASAASAGSAWLEGSFKLEEGFTWTGL